MGTEKHQSSPTPPGPAATGREGAPAPRNERSVAAPYQMTVEQERLADGRSIRFYSAPDAGEL